MAPIQLPTEDFETQAWNFARVEFGCSRAGQIVVCRIGHVGPTDLYQRMQLRNPAGAGFRSPRLTAATPAHRFREHLHPT
jgi:hypothetical protein